MCGIAGITHADGRPVNRDALAAMTDAMTHRGPDARGVEVYGGDGSAPSAGLGHRRLSIIDLSELGRQPLCNEDGTVWVVFNGEIYNFQELRAELEALGHVFRSETDTEAIAHAYEQWGADCVARLDGMFAFAVWDDKAGRCLLARDRFGKKPLYYYESDGSMCFASELQALVRNPDVSREIDHLSLSRYLLYEYVPAPHCILNGVRKLDAGSLLEWDRGRVAVRRYWTPSMGAQLYASMGEADALGELERRFRASVERRLMSDVPLGVFLSGGIDSSAVVSFMADMMPVKDIKTFSIGFTEASFDESDHARFVARAFGTDHRERIFREQDVLDVAPKALSFLSEPMADASILPTYLLSNFTREHVTVALGGDGGDELFAGYDPFSAIGPAKLAALAPAPVRRALAAAVGMLPSSERNMSLDFKLKQFLKGMEFSSGERLQAWMGSFVSTEQQGVLSADVLASLNGFDPMADVAGALGAQRFRDDVDEASYFFLTFYMAGHILPKVDTASMANSLEARAPFLDTALAEFVCGLPSDMKLRGRVRKRLLKDMLRSRLPKEILARPKKGFGIPLNKWIKGGLRGMVEEYLDEKRLRHDGLFNPAGVRALVDAHMRGERDNRKQLWTLVVFQYWKERVLLA